MKIEHFCTIIDKTTVAYQHAKEREWFIVVLDFVAFNLKDCNHVHYIHFTFYLIRTQNEFLYNSFEIQLLVTFSVVK